MTVSEHGVVARLRIDLDALAHNWRVLGSLTQDATCAAVVKADAYGLGAVPVAQQLYRAGCRDFFVALLQEGLALRPHLGADARLWVLHGVMPGAEAECAQAGLIPVLNSLDQVQRWQRLAQQLDRPLPAALQADTGMARVGLSEAEWRALAALPAQLHGIDVQLVMSHLASAEEVDNPLNVQQRQAFAALCAALRAAWPQARASLANSSGIFLGRSYHFDLLRPGAALYGVAPRPGQPHPLKPVVGLQGRLIQCRDIAVGQGVGYNHTWVAERPSRIATLSVGYADGYLRSLSNHARLRFEGQSVPLVGRVSMDTLTVDVTDVPAERLQPGAWFDLLDGVQDINALAHQAGTNAYEVLTSLGGRYQRRYLGAA